MADYANTVNTTTHCLKTTHFKKCIFKHHLATLFECPRKVSDPAEY